MKIQTGHYFNFERGEYRKEDDEPTQRFPASGVTYVGGLTREQRDELDKRIDEYLDEISVRKLRKNLDGT